MALALGDPEGRTLRAVSTLSTPPMRRAKEVLRVRAAALSCLLTPGFCMKRASHVLDRSLWLLRGNGQLGKSGHREAREEL